MIELSAIAFVVALIVLTYCWTKMEDRMTDEELLELRCDGAFGESGSTLANGGPERSAEEWRRRYLSAAAAYVDMCAAYNVLREELDEALRAKIEAKREASLLKLQYRNIDVDPATWTPWFALRKRLLDWMGADL